jgi:hypothetical protein
MAGKIVHLKPRKPSTSSVSTAMDDLARVAVEADRLTRAILLHEYALRGMLASAVSLKVPPAEIPEFMEPVSEGLSGLYSQAHDLVQLTLDVGQRLHRGGCRS